MEKLKQFLDEINYNYLIKCANPTYYENPFPIKDLVKLNIEHLPLNLRKIISFFFLGDSILSSDLNTLFPIGVINELKTNSLITQDGITCKMSGYCIVSAFGYYLLTSLPYYYKNDIDGKNNVYIGFDSFSLTNYLIGLNCNFENVLDVGSGSGIQSFALSKKAKSIIGIDINENAIKTSNLNKKLNLTNNISFFNTNIRDYNTDEKFDLIVSNPPFIPISKSMEFYSIAGNGGVLGIDVIANIIDFSVNHITENGKLVISGECLGKSDGSLIIENFFEKLNNFGFSMHIYLLETYSIETFYNNVCNFCEKAYGNVFSEKDFLEVKLECEKANFTTYNKFLLICEKNNKKTCQYIRQKDVFTNKVYKLNLDINLVQFQKLPASYLLIYKGKKLMQVDEEARNLLMNNKTFNYNELLKKHKKDDLNSFLDELLKCKIIKEE